MKYIMAVMCVVMSFVIIVWAGVTLMYWVVFNHNNESLEGILLSQAKFVREMTITEAQRDAQVRKRLHIDFDAMEKDWQAHEALNRLQYEPPDPEWNPNRKIVCHPASSSAWGDPGKCYLMVRDNPDAEWVVLRGYKGGK